MGRCIKTKVVTTVLLFELDPITAYVIFVSPFKQESICGNRSEPDRVSPTASRVEHVIMTMRQQAAAQALRIQGIRLDKIRICADYRTLHFVGLTTWRMSDTCSIIS